MTDPNHRDLWLYLSTGVMVVPLLVCAVLVANAPGVSFGNLILLGMILPSAMSISVAGLIWLMITVYRRRPLKGDVLGWTALALTAGVSFVVALFGSYMLYFSATDPSSDVTVFMVGVFALAVGVLGIALCMGAAIPEHAPRARPER